MTDDSTRDAWNPDQYERFRAQRLQPGRDLLALVDPAGVGAALDLGCGTGELTLLLADALDGSATIEGIDNSSEMLARAAPRQTERVFFKQRDIVAIESFAEWDLVFSNAALHWVPDHESLFARLLGTLRPGAQIAVQMPWNGQHPSHATGVEVAMSEPFARWMGGFVARMGTLPLERYAQLFFEHGFHRTQLREQVYSHVLDASGDVVEWVKGTTLLPYLERLDAEQGAAFLDEYRRRLMAAIGERAPYLFTFRRMFLWGIKS